MSGPTGPDPALSQLWAASRPCGINPARRIGGWPSPAQHHAAIGRLVAASSSQTGCSTPSSPEGSHGTRADAASPPAAVPVRGQRSAAPGTDPSNRRRARSTGRGAGPDLHGRVTDPDFTATPRRRRAHSTGRGGAPPGPAWTDDSDGGPADRQGPAGPTRSGARRGVSRARPDRAGQLADYPLLTA